MQTILRLLYLAYSPVLVVLYFKNSLKSLENVHETFELNFAE
jgi:hypothetical protein